MAFSLAAYQTDRGADAYYQRGFQTLIETHRNILRNHPETSRSRIDSDLVYRYEGDFYGLMGYLGVPFELRWIYLRVNGYTANYQFGQHLNDPYSRQAAVTLILPSRDLINDLREYYTTLRD